MNPLDSAEPTFPLAKWRLIIESAARSGPANMAIDHAIAEAAAKEESLPTLRYYRWSPPALSLGRHQSVSEIDFEAAASYGYEVVRRTTGGRAILHIDELTYSIMAPKNEPRVQGGIMDSYLRLSRALLNGLKQLGVEAETAAAGIRVGKEVSAACFEVPSAYEITVAGRKLIGSAQSRRRGYVLQHGTLPLTGDITRVIQVLNMSVAERQVLREKLSQRACTLEEVRMRRGLNATAGEDSSRSCSLFKEAARALTTGFAQTLNLDFSPSLVVSSPTDRELDRAAQLIREQYGNRDWTFSKI